MGRLRGGGRGVGPALIGLVVAVVGVIVTILIFIAPVSRVIARVGVPPFDAEQSREIDVRCGVLSTSADSDWGGAAGTVCEGAALSRLVRAGTVALVAGIVVLVLAAQRPGQGGELRLRRLQRLGRGAGSLLVAFGLSAAGIGLGMQLATEEVIRLTGDRTPLTEVADRSTLVASFEVIGLGSAGGGRYEEELWLVIDAEPGRADGAAVIRDDLVAEGWGLGDAPEESNDGWVEFRGLAGADSVDQVEIGMLDRALDPEADLSANARRLLEAETDGASGAAVAVHLTPSRLAGG